MPSTLCMHCTTDQPPAYEGAGLTSPHDPEVSDEQAEQDKHELMDERLSYIAAITDAAVDSFKRRDFDNFRTRRAVIERLWQEVADEPGMESC